MTDLELQVDGIVIHCPDCDASLVTDNPAATLAHCRDGSHVFGIGAVAHDWDDEG